ncbi:TPA: type VI secretion system baseplate subunit TssF [Salmonella enterica]|uniref:Type VI secretion system baseplate subunit TssF n=1 Tax=Salmonella enterica TaxID=28901 RepID=A0A747XJ45_SALER|nr:type VI secretion system baseplate subunit TssF [Salmonella enterica]HAF4697589.1 type VI secretion system baseplate subunit TssF [Salmonella enterica]
MIMIGKFIDYFQNELVYLKRQGRAFARQYPNVARRLGMTGEQPDDPHVERIIESFAFLTAGIHQRLDEDLPEVAQQLLSVVAPWFLRTYPPVCIVQFEPDPDSSGMSGAYDIPGGTVLTRSAARQEARCRFTTLSSLTLLPLCVTQAGLTLLGTQQYQLTLSLLFWGTALSGGKTLRFYLHGGAVLVDRVYALLCAGLSSVSVVTDSREYGLSLSSVRPAPFSGRALSSSVAQDCPENAVIQDYFHFRETFYFIDICLPDAFLPAQGERFQITMLFRPGFYASQMQNVAHLVVADFFRLNCIPAMNLYPAVSEPLSVSAEAQEYPVIPDTRNSSQAEVWSVNGVTLLKECEDRMIKISLPHLYRDGRDIQSGTIYWQERFRREPDTGQPQRRERCGIALSEVGPGEGLAPGDVISIQMMCTDGDLPSSLVTGGADGDFEAELPFAGVRLRALTVPTRPVRPALSVDAMWQLISTLSLNYMLLSRRDAVAVLKKSILLHNVNDDTEVAHLVSLIQDVSVQGVYERLIKHDPCSCARGVEVVVTFYSQAREAPGLFLFCRVVACFLGGKVPVNSFARVITRVDGSDELSVTWPVQTGRLVWL